MKSVNMGVLVLVAHLIITLVIIGGYIYTLAIGHPDETLKAAVFAILGYWFGAIGYDKLKGKGDKPSE